MSFTHYHLNKYILCFLTTYGRAYKSHSNQRQQNTYRSESTNGLKWSTFQKPLNRLILISELHLTFITQHWVHAAQRFQESAENWVSILTHQFSGELKIGHRHYDRHIVCHLVCKWCPSWRNGIGFLNFVDT